MSCRSLPVLMYHYISRYEGSINISPELFAAHCKGMKEAGWRGVGLDEAEAFFARKISLPKRSCLISFDDGFLDNYVYAWPVLKKYGHTGVIFAVTDRLGKEKEVRPTLREVWAGKIAENKLPPVNLPVRRHRLGFDLREDLFLNWSEARLMEKDGMALAGHSARHSLIFASAQVPPRYARTKANSYEDALRRFYVPRGHGNTFYLVDDVAFGLPRLAEQPFFYGPAFLPDKEFVDAIKRLVPQDEDSAFAFFQNPDKVRALHYLVDSFGPDAPGRMETEEECRLRMRAELLRMINTLKEGLGHELSSLCWPWGKYCHQAVSEAKKLGLTFFYTTRAGCNLPGKKEEIKRFKVRGNLPWLKRRLQIYANPVLAELYSCIRGGS